MKKFICPFCRTVLDFLYCYEDVTNQHEVQADDFGTFSYEDMGISSVGDSFYACPNCREVIANTEMELDELVKKNNETPREMSLNE